MKNSNLNPGDLAIVYSHRSPANFATLTNPQGDSTKLNFAKGCLCLILDEVDGCDFTENQRFLILLRQKIYICDKLDLITLEEYDSLTTIKFIKVNLTV